MLNRIKPFIFVSLILIVLAPNFNVNAQLKAKPHLEGSPYDLVNAVNALRGAYGLPAYSINSILMFTAQNQADFMAVTGHVIHSGGRGSNLFERFFAAGELLSGGVAFQRVLTGNV